MDGDCVGMEDANLFVSFILSDGAPGRILVPVQRASYKGGGLPSFGSLLAVNAALAGTCGVSLS